MEKTFLFSDVFVVILSLGRPSYRSGLNNFDRVFARPAGRDCNGEPEQGIRIRQGPFTEFMGCCAAVEKAKIHGRFVQWNASAIRAGV